MRDNLLSQLSLYQQVPTTTVRDTGIWSTSRINTTPYTPHTQSGVLGQGGFQSQPHPTLRPSLSLELHARMLSLLRLMLWFEPHSSSASSPFSEKHLGSSLSSDSIT